MVGSSDRGAVRAPVGSRSLEPGDFSFYGFGDLRRDEVRKILRLGIRVGAPAASTIDDVVFVPNGYERGPGQPKFAGGIVKPDGQPIESAQTHRKGGKRFGGLAEPLPVEPVTELDEEVIYLGLLFNHYGRVLLESLARIWYLNDVDPSAKVIFNNANSAQADHAPWVPRILSMFGIPPERILSLKVPTRLRRAIVPEPLFEQLYSAHREMVRPFREAASRVAGDVMPSEQPLYLSRSRLSSRQRPVIGEPELEDVLRDNGFLVAYPETMTIEEQVRLINAHQDIFSCLGSAAHTILFALGQPRLHLLVSRDAIPANYFLCSALAAAPTAFVNCLGSGGYASATEERLNRRAEALENGKTDRPNDGDAGSQSSPQLLDMSRAVDYLAERGFLKNRSRAAVDSRELQQRFDEAWVYARLRKGAAKSGTLPPDIEAHAEELAAGSWPVSLMLARQYARSRDAARTEAMVKQFATLAEAETDADRLAYYSADMHALAARVARVCSRELRGRVGKILADRFPAKTHEGGEDAPD